MIYLSLKILFYRWPGWNLFFPVQSVSRCRQRTANVLLLLLVVSECASQQKRKGMNCRNPEFLSPVRREDGKVNHATFHLVTPRFPYTAKNKKDQE